MKKPNVHKTMTLTERKKRGYEGYLERALCNERVFVGYCMPAPFFSRLWKNVDCERCKAIRRKRK